MAALTLSVMSLTSFLMSNYNHFVQSYTQIKGLYGHTEIDDRTDINIDAQEAKFMIKDRLESRKEFSLKYWGWLFYGCLLALRCNCITRCCPRSLSYSSRIGKYEKFKIALQRLSIEHDI